MKEILTRFPKCSSQQVLNFILRGEEKQIPRGLRAELARFMNCHPTYLGQLISGKVLPTLDQACLIGQWANLGPWELDIFLNLLSYERAGTQALKDYYLDKLHELLKQETTELSQDKKRKLQKSFAKEYFSNWDLQVIHACLQIEKMSKIEKLCEKLDMEVSQLEENLLRLKEMGLVEKKGSRWVCLNPTLHLSEDPGVRKYFHTLYRLFSSRRIMDIEKHKKDKDYVFSSLLIIDEATQKKILNNIKSFIQKTAKDVEKSSSKEISVLNIDFFHYTS